MSIVVKAPGVVPHSKTAPTVFLCGSIEMGAAVNWQAIVEEELKDLEVIICNPRRDDWDSSWEQKITNPQFSEQVNWELDNIELADIVIFNFDPATKSPVTLLELGKASELALHTEVLVCCPEGFWRKGNVDILCARSGIKVYENLDEMITRLRKVIVEF